ncbi:hypothetical protein [Paremcibacter congregatus]|uniref:hypothetical protein n=1 Tax=Paremcibacter congregatus TaxID=2043170 RepID=UPI0030EDE7BA|tara:strand:+ start:7357 stop:7698 length:342 start_codon:yes stop_codon:yes gene_type:complete
MIHTVTLPQTLTIATLIALVPFASSSAYAHEPTNCTMCCVCEKEVTQPKVSESQIKAKKIVKRLMKRKYDREGYEARAVRKQGDMWEVTIIKRKKPFAIAYINAETGDIRIEE